MSLSTSPDYLAKNGIRAQGGARDGQWLDDGALLWRVIRQDDGYYRLTGNTDGLIYIWEPHDRDLAPQHTRTPRGGASND